MVVDVAACRNLEPKPLLGGKLAQWCRGPPGQLSSWGAVEAEKGERGKVRTQSRDPQAPLPAGATRYCPGRPSLGPT